MVVKLYFSQQCTMILFVLFSLCLGASQSVAISSGEPCVDTEESCVAWAAEGFCDAHRDLMSLYCPVTCGVCTKVAEGSEVFTEIIETVAETTGQEGNYEDTWGNEEKYEPYEEKYEPYEEKYEPYEEKYEPYEEKYEPYETVTEKIYDYSKYISDVVEETASECRGEVKNGKLIDMKPSNYGYVECNEGFNLKGSYYVYCDAQGMITGELPTCERKCSEIPIENGAIEPPQNDMAGWVYISCNDGYTLNAEAWIWCNSGVIEKVPTCTPNSNEENVEEEEAEEVYGSEGEEPEIYVEEEEEVVEKEEEEVEEEVDDYTGCPLETVTNGQWTDPYGSATYWILECDQGFVKDGGDEYSYCSAEKEVSGTSPTCKEDPCSKVTVENGSVVNPNPGSGDSWVWLEATCDAGYTMTGNSGSYCNSVDGSITGSIGPCTK